jgi:hypothetical protein
VPLASPYFSSFVLVCSHHHDNEELDGVNHIGFGVLRHLADHLVLADDERSAVAATRNGGGDQEDNNNNSKVIVAEEKKDKRADDGYTMREKLTTPQAGDGDHGEDITDVQPQQSTLDVDVDAIDGRKDASEQTEGNNNVVIGDAESPTGSDRVKGSSWRVWRWFSSSSSRE